MGIEVSGFASSYAADTLGQKVLNMPLRDAHFSDAGFDIVTLWDVIEHFPEPSEELCEINRIMTQGGILGIITPDIGAPIPRLLGKHWLELKRVPEHLSFFSAATLSAFLHRAGFDIVYASTIGKKFMIHSMLKNLGFQSRIFGPIFRWANRGRCSTWTIPLSINPLYKMLIFARKIADLPEGRLLPPFRAEHM